MSDHKVWTKKDRDDTRFIKNNAHASPSTVRLTAIDMLKRHRKPDEPPTPSAGLNFSFLFPKVMRAPDGMRHEYRYQANSTFLNADKIHRQAFIEHAKMRGENTIMFDVTGGPNRWLWPQEPFDFFNGDGPKVIRDALLELRDAGMKGVPLLYSQDRVEDYSWDQIETSARRHALVWGGLVEVVWAFFEVDESVPPKEPKEGVRGDDWTMGALSLIEQQFGPEVKVACQWSAGEINHANYQGHIPVEPGGPTYPHPPMAPPQRNVVFYQFYAGDPRRASYRVDCVEDWVRTLNYPEKHRCADRQQIMALEHSQYEGNLEIPSWDMQPVAHLSEELAAIGATHPSCFKGSGMGA